MSRIVESRPVTKLVDDSLLQLHSDECTVVVEDDVDDAVTWLRDWQ